MKNRKFVLDFIEQMLYIKREQTFYFKNRFSAGFESPNNGTLDMVKYSYQIQREGQFSMDTVYYHLNARKVKVSGGADLVTFVPVAAPAPAEQKGEVLDFARCRQRLETKDAWKTLARTAQEAPRTEEPEEAYVQDAPVSYAPPSRRERAESWLELCATVAIIAVSLAAVFAFLRLL